MKRKNFEGRKRIRKVAAETRQKLHNALSIVEKISKLDVRLGIGKGAVKERAKLG